MPSKKSSHKRVRGNNVNRRRYTILYNYLKMIKTSTKPQILKDANHPAYLDQPEEWHTLLYNFPNILQ